MIVRVCRGEGIYPHGFYANRLALVPIMVAMQWMQDLISYIKDRVTGMVVRVKD